MFSKDLEVSIANLFDKAQEINIQYLTVEHLFLMILNDYDVKDFIEAQNVSVDTLKDELNEHLKKSSIMRTDNQKAVQPTLGFQRVLQRAVFHIQSSGKGVVKPINLLVAIFSEKEIPSSISFFSISVSLSLFLAGSPWPASLKSRPRSL